MSQVFGLLDVRPAVAAERLVHGKHDPRQTLPTLALRRSVASSGAQRPLIVRLVSDHGGDQCQVIDGRRRYQAATDSSWDNCPSSRTKRLLPHSTPPRRLVSSGSGPHASGSSTVGHPRTAGRRRHGRDTRDAWVGGYGGCRVGSGRWHSRSCGVGSVCR